MTCKQCAYLVADKNKNGVRIVRKGDCYRCTAPMPAMPAIPDSVTKFYSFKWDQPRRHMTGADGEGCPAFKALEGVES